SAARRRRGRRLGCTRWIEGKSLNELQGGRQADRRVAERLEKNWLTQRDDRRLRKRIRPHAGHARKRRPRSSHLWLQRLDGRRRIEGRNRSRQDRRDRLPRRRESPLRDRRACDDSASARTGFAET